MTADKLKQYKSAQVEISRMLRELEHMPDDIVGVSVVKSSLTHEPYTSGHYTQHGHEPNPKKEHAKKKLERLEGLVDDVENFMLNICDPNISLAIRLHYFEGLPWWKAASEINCEVTGDAYRKKVKNFLKKF